ncbi:hypothetical protein cand_020990 [Cryptosporidium andersoni]|uniref:Uncharacterized protein n=1 Tax=Cryptosporidium andersoni TaxID=117008 RepID=A0A1J4MW28_9CRYT|nr:hypothetical protein cand_020990 [Cryptosporidium andersoni]
MRVKDSCVGPAPSGISRILNDTFNKAVLHEFFIFSVFLALLPCGIFLVGPYLLRFVLNKNYILLVSAILSVIVVNIICYIYIYRAYIQEKSEWEHIGPPCLSQKEESRKER